MVSKMNASASPSAAKSDEAGDNGAAVREMFDGLSRDLNMDTSTSEAAWQSYEAIKQNYTLEGNQVHWLACALYVACRNSNLPTVGKLDTSIEGNGVSLTRLLRCCKLSLVQFFNKVKKWADMSNLKSEFREKIEHLERNFAVSNVIFKKYQPIFVDLFRDPSKDAPKAVRSRKQKKAPCTPTDVFNFCWSLFVRVKADFPALSDDLVNSYHLLLSCVDYIYANAVLARRTDLLNDKFDPDAVPAPDGPGNLPCVLDKLIRTHEGIIIEVKTIREQYWRPHIKTFFDRKLLKGEPDVADRLCGILEPANFEVNAKMIRRDYEAFVLGVGEYDERIFLDEEAAEEIGTPGKHENDLKVGKRGFDATFAPLTPLSGNQYLRSKEQMRATPVSMATYQVSRLKNLLGKNGPEPGAHLLEILRTCGEDNAVGSITERVKKLGDTFCQHYVAATESHPGTRDSFARARLQMGVTLYYKLLEKILDGEKSKSKPLGNLVTQDLFHGALFACCLEIVIVSYSSQRTFPWILETFDLEPFHFYKVIEIIIRVEDSLARDVVKHLQRIEEQVLESRAWVAASPLWEAIEKEGVPSCEDVSLPGNSAMRADPSQSPLSHHGRAFSVVRSPMAVDRFKSPVVTAVARRRLAFDEGSPVKVGQSLLASPHKVVFSAGAEKVTVGTDRPKKTGSLSLFFRKVYFLAHLRLDTLCHSLEVTEDNKRKIWTTFEHALREKTSLMKDRHLDQILMCSLYIVLRVVNQAKNFTDIMKHYKNQPQAASHVYRSVLLKKKAKSSVEKIKREDKAATPPTPTRLAATSSIIDGEERGDLINFYNNVFMEQLQEFSLKFKRSAQANAPPLSPLPKLRAHPQSPCKKVSENHSVFIRTLKPAAGEQVAFNPRSPHKPLTYSFSRSPAKDLVAINDLMRTERTIKVAGLGKRLLADDGPEAADHPVFEEAKEPPVKRMQIVATGAMNAKLGVILGDRAQST